MKKVTCFIVMIVLLATLFPFACFADQEQAVIDLACPSAILIERSTGEILYEKDADTKRPMASVTKIMTLLLIMEALEQSRFSPEDMVTCSEHAVSMGGSQIYLKEGESLSVSDMIKAIAVSSANDAAVAMGEYVAGSDSAFIKMMNDRASELKMTNTHFENCTGLDAENHFSTARDISVMSAELLKHDMIRDYTTIWMDTLRDGTFGLSNTNKLVRFYEGCTGLKTGSTSKALYCMSASAKRNNMELIAVVLASPTSPKRFEDAKKLLNYGFAGYELYSKEVELPESIKAIGAKEENVSVTGTEKVSILVEKGAGSKINVDIKMDENVTAPAEKGTQVGSVSFVMGEEILRNYPIVLSDNVEKASFWDIFLQIILVFLTV